MKIGELRKMIKEYDKDNLSYIVAELYKLIPKGVRVDKCVDELIENGKPPAGKKKVPKPKKEVYIDEIEIDIEMFYENAKEQYYFAPNRIINKKKRSQWRFEATRYFKDLMIAAKDEENLEDVGKLLEKLYDILTYATRYYTFATTETFSAIKVPQEEFFKTIISINRKYQDDKTFITNSIRIADVYPCDYYTSPTMIFKQIIPFIETHEMFEYAIETCASMIKKMRPKLSKMDEKYAIEERINEISEFALSLAIENDELESGIKFFKKNYITSREEVKLFVICRILLEYKLFNEYMSEYESAVKKGVDPRESLQRIYNDLLAGKTPDNTAIHLI